MKQKHIYMYRKILVIKCNGFVIEPIATIDKFIAQWIPWHAMSDNDNDNNNNNNNSANHDDDEKSKQSKENSNKIRNTKRQQQQQHCVKTSQFSLF